LSEVATHSVFFVYLRHEANLLTKLIYLHYSYVETNDLDLVELKMRIDAMKNTPYAVHITRRWIGAKLLF